MTARRSALAPLLAVLLGSPLLALDATEQAIVAHVRGRVPAATERVRELVEIDSGTLDLAGVGAVAEHVAPWLEELGFTTHLAPSTPDRAPHLVAHRPGGGLHLLLIGHLDTVFEPSSGFAGWHPAGEHAVRAPGITDMKGGDVILVEALGALAAVGALDQLEVTVVMTGDEESAGRPLAVSRAALLEAAAVADFAIGFEDGDGRVETAVIARRGTAQWRLEVTGVTAHSSQVGSAEVGFGAAYELARILDGFRQVVAPESLLTLNPGLVIAGAEAAIDATTAGAAGHGKDNIVAAKAVASGDLRTIEPAQLASVRAAMEAIVAESLPGTTAAISFAEGYPPMAPSAANRELLALLDQVSRDLGHGAMSAVDPRNCGAADVSFAAPLVEGSIDGLGLMGSGGHTTEEAADLRTLPVQIERAAILMLRLARRSSTDRAAPNE